MRQFLAIIPLLIFSFCSAPQKESVEQQTEIEPPYLLARPKAEWVTQRVTDAQERLQASEAGQLVWKSMEFHGGLAKWWNNGPVFYRFNYQPKPGTGTIRDTYEMADYWGSRTRHHRVANTAVEYGWDGQQAWYYPDTATIPYNVRFWSLTPYYFAGMPFVFADQGVNLRLEEDAMFEDQTYKVVRVTFGENVGDAPDDYYVLYLHPETSRLSAIRYVVSYPAYFKDGGHSQEKLMSYDGQQEVNGIIFPSSHKTYMWEDDQTLGQHVTDITLSDIEYHPEVESSYFDTPEGSYIMTSLAE